MLTHDQMNILPSIIAELISLIKTPDREMSTLAVTYCVAAQFGQSTTATSMHHLHMTLDV